jgi:hypothetical protein
VPGPAPRNRFGVIIINAGWRQIRNLDRCVLEQARLE